MVSSSEKSPPIPPSSTFPNSLLPPSLLLGVKTLLPLLNTFKKPNCAGVRFSKTPRPIDARCRAACAAAASLYFGETVIGDAGGTTCIFSSFYQKYSGNFPRTIGEISTIYRGKNRGNFFWPSGEKKSGENSGKNSGKRKGVETDKNA